MDTAEHQPVADVSHEDGHEHHDHDHDKPRRLSPFGHLFRFLGWWLGFTGLYGVFAVCPFCGAPGCPVGLSTAGSVGAFLALCMQDWRRLFSFLWHKVRRKKSRDAPDEEPDSETPSS